MFGYQSFVLVVVSRTSSASRLPQGGRQGHSQLDSLATLAFFHQQTLAIFLCLLRLIHHVYILNCLVVPSEVGIEHLAHVVLVLCLLEQFTIFCEF